MKNSNNISIWNAEKDEIKKVEEYDDPSRNIEAYHYPRAGGLYRIENPPNSYMMKVLEGDIDDNKKILISAKIAEHNFSKGIISKGNLEFYSPSKTLCSEDILLIDEDFVRKIEKEVKIDSGTLDKRLKIPDEDELCKKLLLLFKKCSRFGDLITFIKNKKSIKLSFKFNDCDNVHISEEGLGAMFDHELNLEQLMAFCFCSRNQSIDDVGESDLSYIFSRLIEREFIEVLCQKIEYDSERFSYLTLAGLRLLPKGRDLIQSVNKDSNKCFVAMWFDPSVKKVYEEAIKPAIEDADCGTLKAQIMNDAESRKSNNKIDDDIIAKIKSSRLVIVDLTSEIKEVIKDGKSEKKYIPRGSVCYEAGFAQGLGIDVIWTCSKEVLDLDKLPFDIRQYRITDWEKDKLDDFKKDLKDRIKATVF